MFFLGLYSKLLITVLIGITTAISGTPQIPNSHAPEKIIKPVEVKAEAPIKQPVEEPPYCGMDENGKVQLVGDASTCYIPLRKLLENKGITTPSDIRLEVSKSQRLLRLFVNGEMVKSYVIGLGGSPDQIKTRRGDSATPQGDYYICQKIPQSRFFMSMKVSYPNIDDARRGLQNGLIDQGTYNQIVNAINSHQVPPMNTGLGSDICIHGGGSGNADWSGNPPSVKVRDWTAGCMALDNPEMKELFSFVPTGTPVKILP